MGDGPGALEKMKGNDKKRDIKSNNKQKTK